MGNDQNYVPTLFFIPDISGFTAFVNQVEVNHSTHIITELLDILISKNSLNLKISEVEGDAIFFYQMGIPPTFDEILEQTKEMYINFHKHLQFYDRDRICQCGACSTASGLSLKFICHFGHATKRKVGNFEKLYGSDVTLAHKLLKNNIPSHDYLLFTAVLELPTYIKSQVWMHLEQSHFFYEDIGEITFSYIPLSPLKSEIGEIAPRTEFHSYGKPVTTEKELDIPLKSLHGIVTNLVLRTKWIFGLKLINDHGELTPTIGSKHLCVLPTHSMEFVIASQNMNEGTIEYVEQSNSISWLAPLNIVFDMHKVSNKKSSIAIHIHYRKNWLTRFGLDMPLRMVMKMIAKISLIRLENFIKTN